MIRLLILLRFFFNLKLEEYFIFTGDAKMIHKVLMGTPHVK